MTRPCFANQLARYRRFPIDGLAVLMAIGFAAQGLADAPPASQPTTGKAVAREASRGPVKLLVKVDRDEVLIPQTLTLTISLEVETGVDVALPEIGDTLGDFGVKATHDIAEASDDLTRRIGRTYTLEPFLAGKSVVPAVKLEFKDAREKADGSTEAYEDSVATEPITITVLSNLADLKGPVSLPWPRSFVLLAWAGGLLLAVAAIAILARWWLKRRALRQAVSVARIVPAHEWALAEMDMLDAEGLIERGKAREFYFRINAIVRGYIERRWGLLAGEQTSEEFIRALQHSMFLADSQKETLRRFVDACDPVKYARQQPAGDEIEWVRATARDFVMQTAAREAELPEAVAA